MTTTIAMRKPDPRDALLNVFGPADAPPTQTPAQALITASREDLPFDDRYYRAVMTACEDASFAEVMAAAVDRDGMPAPGRFLNNLPQFKLAGNGIAAWQSPDDKAVTEFVGVPIRIKPYRVLWGDAGGKLMPRCASVDGYEGQGDPGGECDGCPEKKYISKEYQYCRAKSRLYMVAPEFETPVVFDLTAMAREGLRPIAKWAGQQDIALSHLVLRIGLVRNRKGASGFYSVALTAEPVGIAGRPGYDYKHTIDRAGTILDLAERAWAMDVADSTESGGNMVVDTSDTRYQYAGAVEAVQHLDSPALPAPAAPGGDGQYSYMASDNVDVDDLPF